MRYCLSLIIALLVTSAYSEEKTTLYDFRYWTAPDHTRIVIDTEEDTLFSTVSYTHLRAHETPEHLVCRLLLEKKKRYQ